jgi:hypothetical protein
LIIVIRITFDRRKEGREGGDSRKEERMGNGEGMKRGGEERVRGKKLSTIISSILFCSDVFSYVKDLEKS